MARAGHEYREFTVENSSFVMGEKTDHPNSNNTSSGMFSRQVSNDQWSASTINIIGGGWRPNTGFGPPSRAGTDETDINKSFNVPHFLGDNFVGREKELKELQQRCLPEDKAAASRTKCVILYGLGGSGKSQLCMRFAVKHRAKFWGVFWIQAGSQESIEHDLLQLKPFKSDEDTPKVNPDELDNETIDLDQDFPDGDLTEQSSPDQAKPKKPGLYRLAKQKENARKHDLQQIKQALSAEKQPWLLVFDNADGQNVHLEPYMPKGENGSIVITTRNMNLDCKGAGRMQLDCLSADDAVELLRKTSGKEGSENKSEEYCRTERELVIDNLGGLPLAINQAGSYMRQMSYEPDQYIEEFEKKRQDILTGNKAMSGDPDQLYITSTWELSIDAIKREAGSQDALDLLDICACLSKTRIPTRLFRRAWNKFSRGDESLTNESKMCDVSGGIEWFRKHQPSFFRIGETSGDWESTMKGRFDKAIALLVGYSFLKVEPGDAKKKSKKKRHDKYYSIQPLVHTWAFDRMDEQKRQQCLTSATFITCLSVTSLSRDHLHWLLHDLQRNIEFLAHKFIEHKAKFGGSFSREQHHILNGLWAALVLSFQWSKAREFRQKLIGNAMVFISQRMQNHTSITAKFIKSKKSQTIRDASASPAAIQEGASDSPVPNVSSPPDEVPSENGNSPLTPGKHSRFSQTMAKTSAITKFKRSSPSPQHTSPPGPRKPSEGQDGYPFPRTDSATITEESQDNEEALSLTAQLINPTGTGKEVNDEPANGVSDTTPQAGDDASAGSQAPVQGQGLGLSMPPPETTTETPDVERTLSAASNPVVGSQAFFAGISTGADEAGSEQSPQTLSPPLANGVATEESARTTSPSPSRFGSRWFKGRFGSHDDSR